MPSIDVTKQREPLDQQEVVDQSKARCASLYFDIIPNERQPSPLDSCVPIHQLMMGSNVQNNKHQTLPNDVVTQHLRSFERRKVWDKQEVINLDHRLCLFNALLVHLHMHEDVDVHCPLYRNKLLHTRMSEVVGEKRSAILFVANYRIRKNDEEQSSCPYQY